MANSEKGRRHETSKKIPDRDCAKNDNWPLPSTEAEARNRELGKAQAMRVLGRSTMHAWDGRNLGKSVVTSLDLRPLAHAKNAQKSRAGTPFVTPVRDHRSRGLRSGWDKRSRAAP